MKHLSAVILTYNEERNIARCLDSLQGIADEIIVVDSFSTDKTREICHKYQVKFITHEFEGYIEQKNYALSQASSDYILSLDADEALSDELAKSVLETKQNWNADGYTMNRLTNYCGKWIRHSGWYPDRKMRLFDRRKGKWGGVNPHDVFELQPASGSGFIKGDLLHFSYYTIDEHRTQVDRFSDISSRALYKKGKRSNLLKVLVKPLARFVRTYIIKLGFLDGKEGMTIAILTAKASYLKYSRLMHLQRKSE